MGCLYCLQQIENLACVNSCLSISGISTIYTDVAIGGMSLSVIFVLLALVFRKNLKRSLGLKLLAITSLTIGVVTIGLIFNGHWLLKNIPLVIPAVGAGSYITSYFLSFHLLRFSYKPKPMNDRLLSNYAKRASKELGIKKPHFYIFSSKRPQAFLVGGYKKAVFLSKDLIKKLDSNSIKNVVLHELYHLKRRSTLMKNIVSSFGNLTFRILPVPIDELEKIEESEIDRILLNNHKIDMNEVRKKLSN